ncbi:MAG: arginine--tRNA ligase [Bacilli bacterium]|nr:arginine--tRNA ligase [Bacilli bacterium]
MSTNMIKDILENIKEELTRVVKELGYYSDSLEIVLEIPKDKGNGDYATNVAMRLARVARKAPMMIATEIVEKFDKVKTHVSNVQAAGSGFINFTLDIDYLLQVILLINNEQENYGKVNYGNGKKVLLEFVSANPTGYLHLGHGRGAAYGDSLANVMNKAGFDVDKEHYVNDAGNQITNMALSVYERYKELYGLPIDFKEDYYHGKEIITIAEMIKAEYDNKFLDNFDLEFFKEFGTKVLLGNLKKDLERFNVTFDNWFSEKSLYATNAVEKTLKTLHDGDFTYIKDDATWLKTSNYTDEKDRVIVKSDGSYTYLLPDIAYHANKLSRGYDHLIDVLGADHHGYIDRLKAAVSMVGGNSNLIDVEILQMVRVMEDGVEVKMSKRSGKAITLIDLIEEVGSDALRYFYVSKALNTQMDLDLGLMKKKSNENPVFYAQYAHARICSIFRTMETKGYNFKEANSFEHINKDATKNLCLTLLKYPMVIEEAASKRLVHKVTHYIDELAYALHSYYNNEKVVSDDLEQTFEKATILKAVSIVLKDALALMGISAPTQM